MDTNSDLFSTVISFHPIRFRHNANRLTGIGLGGPAVGISYDAANRRVALALPGGIGVAYSYDVDSRVTAIAYSNAGGSLGNLTYTFDADGRVIAKGGSLAATGMPQSVSNAFNQANQMTAFGGVGLSYDANGNLLGQGGDSYVWDARNHLAQITGGNTASFVYDAMGRRATKTINGVTAQYLYDRFNPIQELDASGNPTANLITGMRPDEYFSRTDSAGQRSFLTDTLGSTLALVNSSTGAIATQYTYDPFGNTATSGAASTNPYQFTGRENDQTGLYYYRNRYYCPAQGRFISQDPIDFLGGMILYGYVTNNPIDLVDPFGLAILPPLALAVLRLVVDFHQVEVGAA